MEKPNYNKRMEDIISMNQEKKVVPSLLLHTCCAPCSTEVLTRLSEFFKITVLYYNPNIEPLDEYQKRKEEQIKFILNYPCENKIDFLDCDYDNETFKNISLGLESEKEGGKRCMKCYRLRLEKTAKEASHNFDYFGTSLTVSPYKNATILNEIGASLEKEYGVKFLYSDFKKNNGYKNSIELSKKYNLYRQDYCGCIFSKIERENYLKEKNSK